MAVSRGVADLVVFDPATVADEATYLETSRYPSGIEHVIGNGRPAILDGAETGERPGGCCDEPDAGPPVSNAIVAHRGTIEP